MSVSLEFSKCASQYASYNIIQKRVAQKILSYVKDIQPKKILDLGCGDGVIFRGIDWEIESFVGVDFALGMLDIHPKSQNVKAIYGDFNDANFFKDLKEVEFDFIISASSLQWADDLDMVFKHLKFFNKPMALAIFTSSTFKTINKTASLNSILPSKEDIYLLQKKYFDADFQTMQYKLEFKSNLEMFRYIKKSGVSGSRNMLGYKDIKKLIESYPLKYLEFEVAFIFA